MPFRIATATARAIPARAAATRSIMTLRRVTIPQVSPKGYRQSSILQDTAKTAHSAFANLASAAPIKKGDKMPDVEIKIDGPEGKVNLGKEKGKNVVVLVPGAFSGVCSNQVPPYITSFSDFKAKGINNVYVVAVNDIFVVNAWKDKMLGEFGSKEAEGVKFAADDTAALASALGLTFDAQPVFGGPRLKRGVLVVNDGAVEYVGVEDSPGDITISAADKVIKQL
ncbi:peroxiredoxin 5, atypical 2-Cys peroxiredoxin [Cryptococcus neoformans Ze90-1]|nr:peroxiredoxin 5, atypical 2-Cys peroxiredoxin [Cryptococcus neoformans var. grubii Ze90-1]